MSKKNPKNPKEQKPSKEHIVYAYRFKDGAQYFGHTTNGRLEERQDEHRNRKGENKALQQRLQKEKKPAFKTVSEHETEKQARAAESRAIKKAPKVNNKRGTKEAGNSIYDEKPQKIEKEKKG